MNLLKPEVASVSQMKMIIKIPTLIYTGNAEKGINGGPDITILEIPMRGVQNVKVADQSIGKSLR